MIKILKRAQLKYDRYTQLITAVNIGFQWLVTALFITSLHPKPRTLTTLTDFGKYWYRPEYDIPVFFLGLAVTFILIIISGLRSKNSAGSKIKPEAQIVKIFLELFANICSFTIFVVIGFFLKDSILAVWHQTVPYIGKVFITTGWLTLLLLPSSLTIFILTISQDFMLKILKVLKLLHLSTFSIVLSLLVPIGIFILIYIPSVEILSGQVFLLDQFHHWNGFAMRAALGMQRGLTLGKDIYAQYGVGWPFLFGSIGKMTPLTYKLLLQISMLYTCLYYIGLFFLLRLLTKRFSWSVIGIFLIIYWQLFLRDYPNVYLWLVPGSSILRSPFDVWIFLCLYCNAATKKPFWNYGAIILAGCAWLFNFDTGTYLLVIVLFYIVCNSVFSVFKSKKNFKPGQLLPIIYSLIVGFLTIILGMYIVGGSSVSDIRFWYGVLEGVIQFSSGISSQPFAEVKPLLPLIAFYTMIICYLGYIGVFTIATAEKSLTLKKILYASLSLYGLALCLVFINRSNPANIYYISTPFWILFIIALSSAEKKIITFVNAFHASQLDLMMTALQLSLVTLIGLGLGSAMVGNKAIQQYPNILYTIAHGYPNTDNCLILESNDICGLPKDYNKKPISEVVAWMNNSMLNGNSVALFYRYDSLIYLQTSNPPWFRYEPSNIFTTGQLDLIKHALLTSFPNYVLLEAQPEVITDVWKEIRFATQAKARLEGKVDQFEIWHRI